MNGKQLKNSILQWAIQGKLVPQDPNDEPASILLERIRAEKVRLVKEGKIKKDKNESIINRGDDNCHYEKFADGRVRCIDEEIPFEIPESWCWARLGNIVDFSKSTFVKIDKIKSDDWLLDLEDIEKDSGKVLVKKRMRTVNSLSDKHSFKKGNVLYSKLRPYLNKVVVADEDGFCTSELLCFDFGEINNYYAQVYLMSPYFVEYAMKDAYGVKMPRLGSKQGNNALIPIPPVQEQYRIVERIKVLQPLIETYGNAQTKLDSLNNEIRGSLKKSLLQEAIHGKLVNQCANDEPVTKLLDRIKDEKKQLVKKGRLKAKELVVSIIFKGDDNKYYEQINGKCLEISNEIPFDIPGSWAWCRLSQFATLISGTSYDKGDVCREGIRILRGGNIQDTKLFLSDDDVFLPYSYANEKKQIRVNDIIIVGSTGSKEVIGKPAFITKPYSDTQIGAFLRIVRPYFDFYTSFLQILFESDYYRKHIHTRVKGTNINNIKAEYIDNLLIPLPPLNEIERIVAKKEELYSKL